MATGPPALGPKPPDVTVPMVIRRFRRKQLRAGAHRRLAGGLQADPQALRPGVELGGSPRRREAAFACAAAAPYLLDRPFEIGFHRRGGLVDIVAVKAEPGFEPERIARAEPDRLDMVIGKSSRAIRSVSSAGIEIS
jgi:hypothetical protein